MISPQIIRMAVELKIGERNEVFGASSISVFLDFMDCMNCVKKNRGTSKRNLMF